MLGRAQGNPYFLAELLHLLVDRGLLLRDGDTWVASGPLPDNALPAAVQSVLAARIDGLEATAKSVLRAASVLGIRFSAEALPVRRPAAGRRGTGRTRRAHGPPAASPAQPGARSGGPSPTRWPRDVAYRSLPKADRARRHARAAQWAAGRAPGDGSILDTFVGAQAEQALRLGGIDGPAGRRSGTRGPLRRLRGAGTARPDGPRARRVPQLRRAARARCAPR